MPSDGRAPVRVGVRSTYERSMSYILVGRALPPLAGSAYGMISSAKGFFCVVSGS